MELVRQFNGCVDAVFLRDDLKVLIMVAAFLMWSGTYMSEFLVSAVFFSVVLVSGHYASHLTVYLIVTTRTCHAGFSDHVTFQFIYF